MKSLIYLILAISFSYSQTNHATSFKPLEWIVGSWHGEAMGGETEEVWSAVSSESMMGMFKHSIKGKVNFYELMTISKTVDSFVLRLKHFHSDLKGWEEKDDRVEFPFLSATENEINFDGLRFQKISDKEIHVYVRMKEKGKASYELKFIYYKTNRKERK